MSRTNTHTFEYPGAEIASEVTTSLVSSITSLPERAFRTLAIWQKRYEDRLHLVELGDHLIRDVGLSRGDVLHEAAKPFWKV